MKIGFFKKEYGMNLLPCIYLSWVCDYYQLYFSWLFWVCCINFELNEKAGKNERKKKRL